MCNKTWIYIWKLVRFLFNDKIILKSEQRFKRDHHKVYTEEVNKTALSSDDDKRLQTFDKIETYPYGTNAFKVCESEIMVVRHLFVKKICRLSALRWKSIKTIKMSVFNVYMINFDDYVNENRTEQNKTCPYIPGKPYTILIIEGSGSGKTNLLLNLIENQPGIDKIYICMLKIRMKQNINI